MGNGTLEGSSHCPHPVAGAPTDPGCLIRSSRVLVPKLCAPERRRVPPTRPCGAPISSQRLQTALQPPAGPPHSACTSHRPAAGGTCGDAPQSDPRTRALLQRSARRSGCGADPRPQGPCPPPPRLPAVTGGLIHSAAQRGRGGETRISAESKLEPRKSPGWRG